MAVGTAAEGAAPKHTVGPEGVLLRVRGLTSPATAASASAARALELLGAAAGTAVAARVSPARPAEAASSEAVPYPGGCEPIAPAYRSLVGLNLVQHFRLKANELLGGVRGCTHLTEMLAGMPTAAIQSFAGEMKEERDDGSKPFQLDQCHALETTGETVRVWYPKWYRGKAA